MLNLFQLAAFEVVGVDDKFSTHEVEQCLGDLDAVCRLGMFQGRMAGFPDIFGLADFAEGDVVDFEQAALFQVGRGDSPAATQIVVEAIAQDVAQGTLRVHSCLKANRWVGGVLFERQSEGIEDPLGEFLMGDAILAGLLDRLEERGTKGADFDKVIEMARLQGGVLAVVGEAEQLLGVLREIVVAEGPNRREAQQSRGGASPFGTEC